MREKEYFTRAVNLDITAATIGINREDWYCYKPNMNRNEIKQTMLLKKYDIVPIYNKQGIFESYFTLNKLDNSLIVTKIEPDDRLYYLTHIKDAVWKMKKTGRTHFFFQMVMI